jgi:hypothetical protein
MTSRTFRRAALALSALLLLSACGNGEEPVTEEPEAAPAEEPAEEPEAEPGDEPEADPAMRANYYYGGSELIVPEFDVDGYSVDFFASFDSAADISAWFSRNIEDFDQFTVEEETVNGEVRWVAGSARRLIADPGRVERVVALAGPQVLLVLRVAARVPHRLRVPSNARMWVATRSRNHRSWLVITAHPAKSSSASSSDRSVSTSRSLVGSSSSSRFASFCSSFARWMRLRSPPEQDADVLLLLAALEAERGHVGARGHLGGPQLDPVPAAGDLLEHAADGSRSARTGRRRTASPCRRPAACPRRAPRAPSSSSAVSGGGDDHPEQGGLARAVGADDPDDATGRQRERQVVVQQPVAESLGDPVGLDDHRPSRGPSGIMITGLVICLGRSRLSSVS